MKNDLVGRKRGLVLLLASVALVASGADSRKAAASWAADNGNETYSNPLFYDEFSDPDMIRVGSDYYLTGTTMHTRPGDGRHRRCPRRHLCAEGRAGRGNQLRSDSPEIVGISSGPCLYAAGRGL